MVIWEFSLKTCPWLSLDPAIVCSVSSTRFHCISLQVRLQIHLKRIKLLQANNKIVLKWISRCKHFRILNWQKINSRAAKNNYKFSSKRYRTTRAHLTPRRSSHSKWATSKLRWWEKLIDPMRMGPWWPLVTSTSHKCQARLTKMAEIRCNQLSLQNHSIQ